MDNVLSNITALRLRVLEGLGDILLTIDSPNNITKLSARVKLTEMRERVPSTLNHIRAQIIQHRGGLSPCKTPMKPKSYEGSPTKAQTPVVPATLNDGITSTKDVPIKTQTPVVGTNLNVGTEASLIKTLTPVAAATLDVVDCSKSEGKRGGLGQGGFKPKRLCGGDPKKPEDVQSIVSSAGFSDITEISDDEDFLAQRVKKRASKRKIGNMIRQRKVGVKGWKVGRR